MRYRSLTVGQSHEIADALAPGMQYGIDAVAVERVTAQSLTNQSSLTL